MELFINDGEKRVAVEVQEGATALEAIRAAGVGIDAPCGGNGTCGKCRALIHDESGVSFRLACQTDATEGMEVVIESKGAMAVSTQSSLNFKEQWPADGQPGEYAIAYDIGTTTVACRLLDMSTGEVVGFAGQSNPQIAYGADVISRITAVSEGHLRAMQRKVVNAAGGMIKDACEEAGVTADQVKRITLVGNTVMQHLAAGIDPTPIGVAPFIPPSLFGEDVMLQDEVPVYFGDCLASYVGADVTVGMLACGMYQSEKPILLLDLGTNGEMALGNKDGIIACATAAGPVFEGANIRFGMPAYSGAISKVRMVDGELELNVIGDCEPVGICGTGLIDAVSVMLEAEILDETGRIQDEEDIPEEYLKFVGEDEDGSPTFKLSEGVFITQKDVRSLQLAKAAVCAGIQAMMKERGISMSDITQLYIAGGFGEYMNMKSAANVGLFPAELLPVAHSVGNTAIEGSCALACSLAARAELKRIVSDAEYLELSTYPPFNDYYVEAMYF